MVFATLGLLAGTQMVELVDAATAPSSSATWPAIGGYRSMEACSGRWPEHLQRTGAGLLDLDGLGA